MSDPTPFRLGDKVQRKPGSGYLFPGVVVSMWPKLSGGKWLYAVECVVPGCEGMTHIFRADDLEHRQ